MLESNVTAVNLKGGINAGCTSILHRRSRVKNTVSVSEEMSSHQIGYFSDTEVIPNIVEA